MEESTITVTITGGCYPDGGRRPPESRKIKLTECDPTEVNEYGMAWDAEAKSWKLTAHATDEQIKRYKEMAANMVTRQG